MELIQRIVKKIKPKKTTAFYYSYFNCHMKKEIILTIANALHNIIKEIVNFDFLP